MTTHAYSPSNCPSVDGQGCLYRERLADGTYSRTTCQKPMGLHPDRLDETPKPLKVVVKLTIEVDREAWALAYGERDAALIRESVKSMFFTEGIFASDSGASVVAVK